MNISGWLQLGLYVVVLLLLAKPLGAYMAAVYEGRATTVQRIGGPLERLAYRSVGIDPNEDMHWTRYALAMLWFNLAGGLVVYAVQRLQQWLPLTTLIRHAGKVCTHRQLLADVWGPGHVERGHYVRIYMGQLRHKLEDDPTHPRFLRTEVGVGYRLLVDD